MPAQVLCILHQCGVAAWPDDAAARCRMHRSVGAEGSMARHEKRGVALPRQASHLLAAVVEGADQARGGTDRAGHGVAVALHRSTMWREGAVEEADYDDNIREHIVDGAFLSAADQEDRRRPGQGPPDQARQPMVDRRHGQGGRQAETATPAPQTPGGAAWAALGLWRACVGLACRSIERERRMLTDWGHQARACCV